jgi:transposase
LSRRRVASDLGVGLSTLGKWVSEFRPADLVAAPQADLARENERLRLENRVLKKERDIQKTVPGRARLWAVETGRGIRVLEGSRPVAYWRHDTPLKNVARGRLRT